MKMMTEDEFRLAISKLKGITEHIYFHLMGEPTTHPHLFDFMKIARSDGFKVLITTNGSLLKEKGDALIASGAYKVNISVHSFENGSEEAYYSYLSAICDFALKASQAGIITVLRLWNNGYDNNLNEKTVSFFKKQLGDGWTENRNGYTVREKLFLEYGERFEWPDMEKSTIGDTCFCYGLRHHFGILSDGTVVPCCLDHDGDIPLGNIFTDDINEILSSPRAENIKNGFSNRVAREELCRKCGYARRF